jgi:formamidopyrimidine-DNA glycosylase
MVVRFNDARRLGFLDYEHENALDLHKLMAGLGPEPHGDEFSDRVLAAKLAD